MSFELFIYVIKKICDLHVQLIKKIKLNCFDEIHLLCAAVALLLASRFHVFTICYLCVGINKSQTADMYAPSTVNGDTMTGELSSMSDEKSDVNFDANDYVVSAISQYVLSNK